jgi:SAM-dependent methyltransferase
MVTTDYRESHTSTGRGVRYDAYYRPGTALAFYWEHFERPYLEAKLAEAGAGRPGRRYLDFACGTGRILQVGASRIPDATGIDVSEQMLEVARLKVPGATILRADVLREPLLNVGRFDVVTLFRFLVRAGGLREPILVWLREVIRDDGTFIVNNHRNSSSIRGLVRRLRQAIHPSGSDAEILSDRQVRNLLKATGFEVVEDFTFGVVPSYRGRLILPPELVLAVERRAASIPAFKGLAKNHVYVCRPSNWRGVGPRSVVVDT